MTRLAALASLIAALVACGHEDAADIAEYTDAEGRMCTVDRSDISMKADCDVEPPNTCAEGLEAAFTVSPDLDGGLRNCAACIDAPNHRTLIDGTQCTPITCSADADCVDARYTCQSGFCGE